MSDLQPLIDAFHLMWGSYPSPALLVHKSRKIIAANEPCRRGGREPGARCSDWPSPDNHRGCLANATLKTQQPHSKPITLENVRYKVYWLPIDGYPDYYVHFSTERETIEKE